METIRFSRDTRNHCAAHPTAFMERLAHFFEALFDAEEQNPFELDNRMAARMYL